MTEIKPCPCGATPERLDVIEGSTFRWRYVSCGEGCGWMTEVRVTTMQKITEEEEYAECIEGWNALPRSA